MIVEIHIPMGKLKWVGGFVINDKTNRVYLVPPKKEFAGFLDADWNDLRKFVERKGWKWYPIIGSKRLKDKAKLQF